MYLDPTTAQHEPGSYPADLTIDYPERSNRLTVLFRLILAIPITIVAAFVGSGAQYLTLALVLMLLFRRVYPHAWFGWQRYLTEFNQRVGAYVLLLRDEYPSTTDTQAVHVRLDEPAEGSLHRLLPLVKWLLVLPHYIVLFFLVLALICTTLLAWVVILIRGRYPRGLFDFAVGVNRWGLRVSAYAFMLTTDRYPPFSLR